MSEHNMPPITAVRQDAIEVSDFVYAATGARVRRLTMPDGEHWFPATDVCAELGHTNPRKAVADHVHEGGISRLETVTSRYGLSIPAGRGWRRDLNVVNLQGLIMLVNGCTKPECQPFKQWVAEVIETVQREGSYSLPVSEIATATSNGATAYAMPDQVIDLITRLEERNLRLDEEFAAGQKVSAQAQERLMQTHVNLVQTQVGLAQSMARIADALEALVRAQGMPLSESGRESETPATRPPDMNAILAQWRRRIPEGSDVWPVALYLLPEMLQNGDYKMSIDYLAVKVGMTAQEASSCLRVLRQAGCISQLGFTQNGNPVHALILE